MTRFASLSGNGTVPPKWQEHIGVLYPAEFFVRAFLDVVEHRIVRKIHRLDNQLAKLVALCLPIHDSPLSIQSRPRPSPGISFR